MYQMAEERMWRFIKIWCGRLTMDPNSIVAPEAPIFSHGQTPINTWAKNIQWSFDKQSVKRFFFSKTGSHTHTLTDNVSTKPNGVGFRSIGKITIVCHYASPFINFTRKGFTSVTFYIFSAIVLLIDGCCIVNFRFILFIVMVIKLGVLWSRFRSVIWFYIFRACYVIQWYILCNLYL